METSNYIPNQNNDNIFVLFFSFLFILMFIVFCPPVFGNDEKTEKKYSDNSFGDCKPGHKRASSVALEYHSTLCDIKPRHSEEVSLYITPFDICAKSKFKPTEKSNTIITRPKIINCFNKLSPDLPKVRFNDNLHTGYPRPLNLMTINF